MKKTVVLNDKTVTTQKGKKSKGVRQKYLNLNSGSRKFAEGAGTRLALQHSRYLNSVLDPFNEPGARIPDEITAPSFPAQTITKFVLASQAGTSGGSTTIGCGITKAVGSATATYAGASVNTLFPSTALGTYITAAVSGTWTGGTQIATVGQSARLVSAAITAQVLGSYNNDQGRILIGFLPPGDPNQNLGAVGTNVTTTTLANLTYVADIPAIKVAARAIYLPLDAIARSYVVTGSDSKTAARGQASGGFTYMYGQLIAVVDGLPSETPVNVEFQICENWEIIPQSNQLNIVQASVSHSDPLEMAAASNFIGANPTLAQHQPASIQVSGTPNAGMVRQNASGPTFLDRVLSGLEGGLKVAKRVAPVAAEILAML